MEGEDFDSIEDIIKEIYEKLLTQDIELTSYQAIKLLLIDKLVNRE